MVDVEKCCECPFSRSKDDFGGIVSCEQLDDAIVYFKLDSDCTEETCPLDIGVEYAD